MALMKRCCESGFSCYKPYSCDILRLMFKVILPCFLVVLVLGLSGCAPSQDEGKTLATFKGGSVSQTEFEKAIRNLSGRIRAIALREKREFLESFITEKLLLQEAERRALQHAEDVRELLGAARRKILVAKLIEEEVESKVRLTPEDAQKYYEDHKDEFTTPFRIRASHILLRSKEEANLVSARLRLGEDFGEVAKEVSLDPTAQKGGDLGYFEKGHLIPEIEEAAFALDEGEISEIIETSFGFHLIKVTAVIEPRPKDFASVKGEIEDQLRVEEKSRLFSELTDRLKERADISVNEELLSELDNGAATGQAGL